MQLPTNKRRAHGMAVFQNASFSAVGVPLCDDFGFLVYEAEEP